MNEINKTPARIHVLTARESAMSIVLRRGPSWQTAVIGWDREHDTFKIGQWLNGKIYGYRSDISPNGEHWIYLASKSSKTHFVYTAVARTPLSEGRGLLSKK